MQRIGHVWRIRPGLALEYDRRHARVWPELERVMREAGVRTYHIYRWGEIVFSHMDVEDYEKMLERLAGDPVSKRWEKEYSDLLEYPNADPKSGWPEQLRHVWSLEEPSGNEQ